MISVSKFDALNVSAVATACEESYRTGLPVRLSLSNDGIVNNDAEKCPVVNGDVIIDGADSEVKKCAIVSGDVVIGDVVRFGVDSTVGIA